MSNLFKLILIGSIILNLIAIWALFNYIMYGGNPLLELKRKLTGTTKMAPPREPMAEENARIVAEIAEGKTDSLRIVFYGASITHGWDVKKYFPKVHALNRGVGGFVPDLLKKFKANVLDLKPKAAIIKICSINVQPTIPSYTLRDGVEMMVKLAQTEGIQPIVTTMIPAGKPSSKIGEFNVTEAINQFNEWSRNYARDNNLPLIDYARAIEDSEGFLPRDCSIDPIHVNDKGYDILSDAARPVVYQVMGVE